MKTKTQFIRHDEWPTVLDGLDIESPDVHAYLAKCSVFEYGGTVYRRLGKPRAKPAPKAPAPVTPLPSVSQRLADRGRAAAERVARDDNDSTLPPAA